MVKVSSVSQWPPETEWTINRDLLIVIAKKYCRPALSIVEWITSAFKSETTLIMCFGRRRSVLGLCFCWIKSFWKYCVRGQFEYGFQVLSKCHHWPVLDASFRNVLQNACFPWGVKKKYVLNERNGNCLCLNTKVWKRSLCDVTQCTDTVVIPLTR